MGKCCKKCYTNYTEKGYPDHQQYDACKNPNCLCHQKCDNACGHQEPYGFVPEAGCKIHDKPPTK